MTIGIRFHQATTCAMVIFALAGMIRGQDSDYFDAEAKMRKAKREMLDAQDDLFRNHNSMNARIEFDAAQHEFDAAQHKYRKAKRDFADAESRYNEKMWSRDNERENSTFDDDAPGVFGANGEWIPEPVVIPAPPQPQQEPVVNSDIYPGGAVKSSCAITPNLKIKMRDYRTSIAGQISVTLLDGLHGEPIVCLYILTPETERGRRTGKYELRSAVMRPTLGSHMRANVYDGWGNVRFYSRVKDGYGYSGEGSSLEEQSKLHNIPMIKRFTMNETRPDNPFFTLYDKIGAALYHIEVWHSGKCIGIKDGQIGSGIITPPCKDWFVSEQWGAAERRMLKR